MDKPDPKIKALAEALALMATFEHFIPTEQRVRVRMWRAQVIKILTNDKKLDKDESIVLD